MNEAELPEEAPKAIKIGAHFPFGNGFATQHFAPSAAFYGAFLASFCR